MCCRGRRFVILLLLASTLAAVDQPIVELVATPAAVEVGDTVRVEVTYRWPAGWSASEPDPTPAFADEFVAECPPPETARTAQEQRRTWRLALLARTSGAWALPRPAFAATGPAGAVRAEAPAVVVQVGTDAAPPQPAPPRPLISLPAEGAPRSPWWWVALGAAGVAALAALLALARRRRAPPPPPAEVFRADAARLAALADGKAAAAALHLALRRYAGATFGFDGPGATHREASARLKGLLPDGEWRVVAGLLGDLDDRRWAPASLDATALAPLVAAAHRWVDGVQERLDREARERARTAKPAEAP